MSNAIEINELHWLLAVTQNIDVGIVVLDLNYQVSVWNTFWRTALAWCLTWPSARPSSNCFPT